MAGTIKGIIVEIGGDTSGLQKALSKVNSATSSLSKELRGVNSLLKLDPKNTELVAQKQEILSENIENTKKQLQTLTSVQDQVYKKWQKYIELEPRIKEVASSIETTKNRLEQLKKEQEKAQKEFEKGKITEEQYNKINKEFTECKQSLEELRKEQKELNKETVPTENYRAFKREIEQTKQELAELQVQASKWTTAGKAAEEWGNKIDNLGSKIDNLGNKLTTRVTAPLIALGVVGVKSAAEQEAAMQQVELIYGNASDTIKDFAENTAIAYNISTSDAYKYAQVYGNLIQSITNDEEKNALYTQQLLKASSIIASATGRTMEDVMDRIRSGLLGNTEAIEDLGVNVNVAMLETTDAFKKFAGDKSWKQLDFQTQQQIRLFAILEQTTKKYGNEVNKNTSSDIQRLSAKFKNLTSQLSKKLLPIADKLIDKAENFLDSLEDLDDEQIDNIINIGLMVAAAGPLVKILGTTTKVAGGTVKGLGTLSQAIALTGKTSTTAFGQASSATQTLAKAFTALTSPAGLAVTAIGTLAGAIVYFSQKQTDAQKAAKELADEMANQKQSLEEYNQSVQDTLNANLSHIDSVENLKDELKTLVDENGKVKEGYESRVDFILNELNEALGTEYDLNGDVIDSYKDLQKEIDTLIEKKRAQIFLESYEEDYKNAIENQTNAVENMKTAYEQLSSYMQDYGTDLEGLRTKAEDLRDLQEEWFAKPGASAFLKSEEYRKEAEALENVIKAYDDAEWAVQDYTNKVNQYTSNYELFVEEKYSEIGKTVTQTTQDWSDASLETIQTSITEQGKALDAYENIYRETGNTVAQDLANQSIENIQSLAKELASRTSTINELGENEINAWKALAENSFAVYSENVSKMAPEMQKKIQEATGVVIANTDEFAKQAGIMGEKVASEFDKNGQAKQEALKTLQGYYEGLNDKEKNELLKETVGDKADEVAKQFEKGDYETSGKNVLEGIYNGLNNGSLGQSLIDKAAGIAKSIAAQFNIQWDEHSPSKLMEQKTEYLLEPIGTVFSKREKNLVKDARILAKNIVKGFDSSFDLDSKLLTPSPKALNALSTNVIDNTKTVFTTPQIVFNVQELDEAKLEQCFNYINRKFGSQY